MLFALLKKAFLIVKKYVLMMLVVIILIPPFIRWRVPEFTGISGFMLSVIFGIFMLLQYVSLKEYQFPKAATLLCATPFSRKEFVLSKYFFCMIIYVTCCVVFGIETLIIPGLGHASAKLFAMMFLVTSVFIGIYLPLQYKLGFAKAKFVSTVVIMASPIILPLLMRMEYLNLNYFSAHPPYLICAIVIFISFAVLAISAALSVKIYEKINLA